MSTLFPAKGCFYRVEGPTKGESYYKLDPPLRGGDIPIIILNVRENLSDITTPMSCLENVKILYTFGQAIGQVTIGGEVLLGPSGGIKAGESILDEYFSKNRSSNSGRPVKLSKLGSTGSGGAIPIYLTSMRKGRVDPQTHVLDFQISGFFLDMGV